jgi:hypothetical protein
MPKTPINYSSVSFYKLCCRDPSVTETYVGHTTNFTRRKAEHKYACNSGTNLYVYLFINSFGGWDNWDIIEICNRPCDNKRDAERIERGYVEELGATLNRNIPFHPQSEWYQDNKEEILISRKIYRTTHDTEIKQYREDHKDEIKACTKKYSETHKEEIQTRMKKYREDHTEERKAYSKKYREDHKEEIKARLKKYREDHKEEIKAYNKNYRRNVKEGSSKEEEKV